MPDCDRVEADFGAGAPLLSVSVPLSERLFGQGAIGTWKDFEVRTTTG